MIRYILWAKERLTESLQDLLGNLTVCRTLQAGGFDTIANLHRRELDALTIPGVHLDDVNSDDRCDDMLPSGNIST